MIRKGTVLEVIFESLLYGFRVDHQEVPFFEWGRVAAVRREGDVLSKQSLPLQMDRR